MSITSLHHPQVVQLFELLPIRLQSVSANWDPFGPQGVVEQAWQQIRGWDHQLVYGQAIRMASQSCNLIWR